MPAFHASLASTGQAIGKVAIMPLKQTSKGCPRGPAPVTEEEEDIVDQTINLFKVQRISRLLFQYVSAVSQQWLLKGDPYQSHVMSSGKYSLHLVRHGD